jgi:hypothetical protein
MNLYLTWMIWYLVKNIEFDINNMRSGQDRQIEMNGMRFRYTSQIWRDWRLVLKNKSDLT